MEFLHDTKSHGTNGESESGSAFVRYWFTSEKNGRSLAAERRTKTHQGRGEEFAVGRLAGNQRVWRSDCGDLRRRNKLRGKCRTEIRFDEDCAASLRRQRMERGAEGIVVVRVLVRAVRVSVCGGRLLHVVSLGTLVQAARRAGHHRRDPAQQHYRRERAEERTQGCLAQLHASTGLLLIVPGQKMLSKHIYLYAAPPKNPQTFLPLQRA